MQQLTYPALQVAWSVAACDSSNGAGLTNDIATFAACGVHGCGIVTALTAQNAQQIDSVLATPAAALAQQINSLSIMPPQACKISTIANAEQLALISDMARSLTTSGAIPVIYDPVLFSTSGCVLTDCELINAIKTTLLPHVTLITPNINEAQLLSGVAITSYHDMLRAATVLLDSGVTNVLIKGGHAQWLVGSTNDVNGHNTDDFVYDCCSNGQQTFWLLGHKQQHGVRGSGCALSSAIAANMALGYHLADAIVLAKRYISGAIATSYTLDVAGDNSSYYINHAKAIAYAQHTPHAMPMVITRHHLPVLPTVNACAPLIDEIGLYPVVNSSDWVERLARWGVRSIQLRIKENDVVADKVFTMEMITAEIEASVAIAKQYAIQLFINDHWRLAISCGAYGVHLGQEDLLLADIELIQRSGLRLGISTHNYYELAIAIAYQPSYIALGPIFPTKSKDMPFPAHGVTQIARWRAMVTCPLVVIGGINLSNVDSVISVGQRAIALIAAITASVNPEQDTKLLLAKTATVVI